MEWGGSGVGRNGEMARAGPRPIYFAACLPSVGPIRHSATFLKKNFHQFAECRPMAHSVNYLKKPKRLVAECRDDWALGKHFLKKKCPPIFSILKSPCSPLTKNFKKSLLHFCRVPPMQHSANLFLYFMLPFSFLYLITFLYFMFH